KNITTTNTAPAPVNFQVTGSPGTVPSALAKPLCQNKMAATNATTVAKTYQSTGYKYVCRENCSMVIRAPIVSKLLIKHNHKICIHLKTAALFVDFHV